MDDRVLRTFTSVDGTKRAAIVVRSDGAFSYCLQWYDEELNDWGILGPYCGIYDSEETAIGELLAQRSEWLQLPLA